MKRRKFFLMLAFFGLGYAAALWWVFTRSAPLVSSRPVTIRLSHWQIEKGPPDGFDAVIRRYEELNPRVKVEQVAVPGGGLYGQWLRTNLTGGTATDLIEFAYFIGGVNDVPVRYFEPLTGLMNEPNPYNRGTAIEHVPWRLTFADGLYFMISQSPEIGQIYGATLCQGSSRLFCNRELLEKITGGPAVAPATFNDFRALCAKVAEYSQRTGHTIHQWLAEFLMVGTVTGMNMELDREGFLARTPWQSQTDYLLGRWSYRRPELRAALELVRETCQQMRPGVTQLTRDNALQEFIRGEALFIYSGTFDATSLIRLSDFTVVPMRLPQPTKDDPVVGKYITGRFQDGYKGTFFEMYLNKNSPHKAEAIDFLRFLTSVEGGQLFQDHSGWPSSIRGVHVPPELEIQLSTGDGVSGGAQYIGVGGRSTMAFWQHLNLLIEPQGSVDKFIATMEVGLREMITEDLRNEIRKFVMANAAVDSEITAMGALDRLQKADPDRGRRQATLAANQTLSEIEEYEAAWVLQRHGSK